MNEIYESVPNIITGKDLDYLSDMFEWNYGLFKNTKGMLNSIQDEEIKNLVEKSSNVFQTNLEKTLQILGGTNE